MVRGHGSTGACPRASLLRQAQPGSFRGGRRSVRRGPLCAALQARGPAGHPAGRLLPHDPGGLLRQFGQPAPHRLALREFLGYALTDPTPVHASLTEIRKRLPQEVFEAVFQFVLALRC
ncbi:MAG: transposase [Verrucomicrobiales bacterium]|nr:transposase [Verrucomicrobiales bacterium]